jgi:hemerythrin-like domain-containing protein
MDSRRNLLRLGLFGGFGLIASAGLISCNPFTADEEVSANEDLMREHGVLRRALLIYFLSAKKMRSNPGAIAPDALNKTAKLFRSFGEDYHERKLEEPFIFPRVKQADSQTAATVDILLSQHQRGRQITDYILGATRSPTFGNAAEPANALDSFVLMYQQHTAREDTVIFPAWHKALSKREYDEMGDKFEDIEHQQFGKDGFDDAVNQISQIEEILGFADLAQFTASSPPKE